MPWLISMKLNKKGTRTLSCMSAAMDWLRPTQFCLSPTGQTDYGSAVWELLHTTWPCVSSGPYVCVMFSSNTKKVHEEKLKMNFVMIFFPLAEYYCISLDVSQRCWFAN